MKKKKIKLSRIAAFILISLILTVPLVSCSNEGSVAPKEEIAAALEQSAGVDKGYRYVASYLEDYGISAINKSKVRRAELYIQTYMLYELPPTYEIAESTARLFLEYLYDKTELDDVDAVTDAVLSCYISSLGDRYAVYRNLTQKDSYHTDMSGSFVGIGVTVENPEPTVIRVISVNRNSPAEKAGILAGDLIVAVDGVTVSEAGYEATVNAIRGEIGTSVEITVSRAGESLTLTATREKIVEELVSYSIDGEGRGYIKITRFDGLPDDEDGTAKQLRRALAFMTESNARGIVFDLRDNPGGYLTSVVEALDLLVPEGTAIVSYSYKNSPTTVLSAEDDDVLGLPITVICNENTASAGELFCAAVRDFARVGLIDATVVGDTTYGKGVMQSEFSLPDGSIMTFTTAYYNPPSGENYDGEGVIPSIQVTDDTATAVDEQLAAALAELDLLMIQDGISLSCPTQKPAA